MRVALFCGNYNYLREGANQALNRLVRYLEERRGCEVRVYSPVTETPAFRPAGTLIPVPSITMPVRREFQLALGLPRSIRRDIARFDPQLIHVSTPDILNTRAQSFARRTGIPVVASFHTRFETYLGYYGLGWARPLAEAHLRRFYRRSDHVLAPNQALVAEMAELVGEERVSLWGRGVDTDLFHPSRRDEGWRRRQGVAQGETIILFFGRLVREKGIEDFAAVVRGLQNECKTLRPLIVGAGPAKDGFEGLSRAIFTGHLDGEALAAAVASADIMLNPSATEAFGNVVLEAMASGLAIVSADAPSARALVEEGRTALLRPVGDRAAYGEALRQLLASPEQRRALGEAAREASLIYSWDSASECAALAYDKVLEKHRPR